MKKWGSEALSNAPPRETWIFQYGSRRITISQASALKPQAAREVAAQYYAKWLQGIDPQVEKEQAAAKAEEAAKRAAETFGTLAAKYLEKQKTELRRSSFAAQRRYLEKHCASLHRLAIDDIDRAAVIALLNTVEKQRGKTWNFYLIANRDSRNKNEPSAQYALKGSLVASVGFGAERAWGGTGDGDGRPVKTLRVDGTAMPDGFNYPLV